MHLINWMVPASVLVNDRHTPNPFLGASETAFAKGAMTDRRKMEENRIVLRQTE